MFLFAISVSIALVGSFLCSIFESVLLSVSHAEVETLRRRGNRAGLILKQFKATIDKPIAAILILNTTAHTVGASLAGATYEQAFAGAPLWVFPTFFTLAILLLTEIVPKTLGITFKKTLAAPTAHAVSFLVVVLKPVLLITSWMSNLMRPKTDAPTTSIEEIRILAQLGHNEGVVSRRTARIIDGATQLLELEATDVMVPRNDVHFLSGAWSVEHNLAIIEKTEHSRFPYSSTTELDDVEGFVLSRELLLQWHRTEKIDWKALVREPLIVPETKPLNSLLKSFQDRRLHLAVVVDEFGGVDGIVTLEDVLEELVGEITDESDRVNADMHEVGDGWVCTGSAEVRKVFETLQIDAAPEPVTISGFLAEELGDVPKVGDQIEFRSWRFAVTKASARRAVEVSIVPLET